MFFLRIVSPKGLFFEGKVTYFHVRSGEGEIEILPNHMSIIGTISIGSCRFQSENGFHIAACSSGFFYVEPEQVSVLLDDIVDKKNIDIQAVQKQKMDYEERLKVEQDLKEEIKLRSALRYSISQLEISSSSRG